MCYISIGKFGVDEVLGQIIYAKDLRDEGIIPGSVEWKEKIQVPFETENHGIQMVKMNSLRYKVFKKGRTCVVCGVVGTFFSLERHKNDMTNTRYHFNLYAELPHSGQFRMLTKDHIKPKSLGGMDHLDNMQTHCIVCNNKKGNRYIG